MDMLTEEYWELRTLLLNALDDRYHQVENDPDGVNRLVDQISDFIIEVGRYAGE